jgi:ligand-binding sensor domain-containing protein/signal transduction histidine kinase
MELKNFSSVGSILRLGLRRKLAAGRTIFTTALGLVFFAAAVLAADTNQLNPAEGLVIRPLGTGAGLPQNTVNAIVQTRDGYLWLGTEDGLARFDGARFKAFGLREGLQSVKVQSLYEDRRGTLWIGTRGAGLGRLVDDRIEHVAVLPGLGGSDVVTCITEDGEGRLWVGTRGGLILWDGGQFVSSEPLARLNRTAINALMRDRQGRMWIATARQGLFEFWHDRLTEIRGPAGDERILAYCLLEDQAGNLWASVGNGKVLCRRGGQWTTFAERDGLPFAYVTCLTEEADGTIWAGSLDEGLYRFKDGRFTAIRKDSGVSADDIRSLCPDREGNLWVGTRTGGLNRLSHHKLVSYGVAQGLTNDFTRSVAESADGTLWVGTIGGGLYQGSPNGFKRAPPESPDFYYAFVDSVLATPDGSVWYGARRALLRLEGGKLTANFTNDTWLRSASVTALCDDQRGGVWIGTSESELVHFQEGKFAVFPHRIARGSITALAQQPDGLLWVGSEAGGLNGVRMGSDAILSVTNSLLSQVIQTLHLDAAGTLWIGTAGRGLGRYQSGRLTMFTTEQGLWADTISQIVEDDAGALWLGCNRGVFRVSKAELNDLAEGKIAFVHPRVFGLNDGMPAEECSSGFSPAGLKTKSGLLCFSTVKGLLLLDPHAQDAEPRPPEVLLEEVLVNGQVRRADFKTSEMPATQIAPEAGHRDMAGRITIPPGLRELELHYTAISFKSPEMMQFRYRLEGMDQKWIEVGGRRTAYYHRIPPGNYRFRVSASAGEGIWSDPGAVLAITVQPFFWETGWFLAGAVAGTLSLLAGTVRLVERRRYKRRLAVLETQRAVEGERLRISKDMHDDIGSVLTQVSQLSDLGQSETGGPATAKGHFERIGTHARAAVQALDEIVWATNPKNDNLRHFAEYVCRFADEFFENSAMRCWQEVPTDLPNVPFRADLRHNLFLAVKEAFNNTLKHSSAREVWLRLSVENAGACLSVEDNGTGFVKEKADPHGNGLDNMRTRLAECGGRMELTSLPGQGTKIRFHFPLPEAG